MVTPGEGRPYREGPDFVTRDELRRAMAQMRDGLHQDVCQCSEDTWARHNSIEHKALWYVLKFLLTLAIFTLMVAGFWLVSLENTVRTNALIIDVLAQHSDLLEADDD